MEIPSSSPIYTPLKRCDAYQIEDADLSRVELFPKIDDSFQLPPQKSMKNSQHKSPHPSPELSDNLKFQMSSHISGNNADNNDILLILSSQTINSIPSSPYLEEESIMTDDDETGYDVSTQQTFSKCKSTQNYLEELLTESLLESLPLPPDKKIDINDFYKR